MFYYNHLEKTNRTYGNIFVNKPIHKLGNVEDINGDIWHINAIFNDTVCACLKKNLHPYYNDTSGKSYGFVHQKWFPYKVKVVKYVG